MSSKSIYFILFAFVAIVSVCGTTASAQRREPEHFIETHLIGAGNDDGSNVEPMCLADDANSIHVHKFILDKYNACRDQITARYEEIIRSRNLWPQWQALNCLFPQNVSDRILLLTFDFSRNCQFSVQLGALSPYADNLPQIGGSQATAVPIKQSGCPVVDERVVRAFISQFVENRYETAFRAEIIRTEAATRRCWDAARLPIPLRGTLSSALHTRQRTLSSAPSTRSRNRAAAGMNSDRAPDTNNERSAAVPAKAE